MKPLKNDLLLRAIKKEPVARTPLWIMRQAGRYLPEYRAARQRAKSFMHLCQTPELATEVTLQPVERFQLDAAIIFSDILTIPVALGLPLQFIEGKGPLFAQPLRTAKAIESLNPFDPEALAYTYDAIRMTVTALSRKLPLIGFCGSPWTLAAYMVEGKSMPGFPTLRAMQARDKALLHQLLNKLASAVGEHLKAQIEAGVDLVMIFDTWGGLLKGTQYADFSLKYIVQAVNYLRTHYNQERAPLIVYTKGVGLAALEQLAASHCCEALGVDWEISLQAVRQMVEGRVALQGNLNPAHLLLPKASLYREVEAVLASFGKGSGHVFNLGHGITPDVPPLQVAHLVEAVHELSQRYHAERG